MDFDFPLEIVVRDIPRTDGLERRIHEKVAKLATLQPRISIAAALTLLSGPAGGPGAGLFYARAHGRNKCITVDMGGTSFDAALIKHRTPLLTTEGEVDRMRLAVPMLGIVTIGAGPLLASGLLPVHLADVVAIAVGPQLDDVTLSSAVIEGLGAPLAAAAAGSSLAR